MGDEEQLFLDFVSSDPFFEWNTQIIQFGKVTTMLFEKVCNPPSDKVK